MSRTTERRRISFCSLSRVAEVLEYRQVLDSTLSSVIPIFAPHPDTVVGNATFTATQRHDPSWIPIGNQYWYGQPGDKSDGSFTASGTGFKSFVNIWGGTSGGVCNTITLDSNGIDDAGTVEVKVSGLTVGTKYHITVMLSTSGSTLGPSTNVDWTGKPMGFSKLIYAPTGADATSGSLTVDHDNGPLGTSPPATIISQTWVESHVWWIEVTGAAAATKIFRWTPSMSHSGIATTTYTRDSKLTGTLNFAVWDMTPPPPPPPPPMPPGPAPMPSSLTVASTTEAEVLPEANSDGETLPSDSVASDFTSIEPAISDGAATEAVDDSSADEALVETSAIDDAFLDMALITDDDSFV